MKQLLKVTFFILFLGLIHVQAQSGDSTNYFKSVIEQAMIMGNSYVQKDYSTFVQFANPSWIAQSGGKQNIIAQMQQYEKELQDMKSSFLSVTFSEPTKIVNLGTELQCILVQLAIMKIPTGKLITKSPVIAISADKGVHWSFLYTAGKDLQTLRKLFPAISKELIVPINEQPIFQPD